MSRPPPLVLRFTQAMLESPYLWAVELGSRMNVSRTSLERFAARYAFKNDEKAFARELLQRKQNLWIYRCDQQRSCGYFVLVDMSSPEPRQRRVLVIDLKQGGALKTGGGGAGVQLQNAGAAVAAVAREGEVIPEDAAYELVTGDSETILRFLGIDRP